MTDNDLLWREIRVSSDEAKYNARLELLTDLKKIRSESVFHNVSSDFIAGLNSAIDAIRHRLNNS